MFLDTGVCRIAVVSSCHKWTTLSDTEGLEEEPIATFLSWEYIQRQPIGGNSNLLCSWAVLDFICQERIGFWKVVVFYFLFLGIMCTNKSKYLGTFIKNYKHLNLLQNCNDTENDFLNVFS